MDLGFLLDDLGLYTGELVYANPLAQPSELADWCMEGPGVLSFPQGRLRMESTVPPDQGQAANVVCWCPVAFSDHIYLSWDFWPVREPGLAMLFFAAIARTGGSVLDPSLPPREGRYERYFDGAINTLHASYFRRRMADEIRLHTCNLRKSTGFHLVAQGADPIPCAVQASGPYRIHLVKAGPVVRLAVEQVISFTWRDNASHGPVLGSGHIGLRQMSPLIAEYANLRIQRVNPR